MSLDFLIVDDQAFCIEQLTAMARERAPSAAIRVADSLEGAVAALQERPADLIVVELSLPGLGREAGLRRLHGLSDGAILAMDARHDPAAARACRAAGARGYATRSSSRELVSATLAVVMAGGLYFPGGEAPSSAEGTRSLTDRQAEVLEGLMRGQTNTEIAAQLGIALPTVKLHVRAVLKALGARNRTEAAMIGRSRARPA